MKKHLHFYLLIILGTVISVASTVHAQPSYTFKTIDYPGAQGTFANGINDSGTIVGYYKDAKGALHGFRDSAGTFTPIDYPDALLTFANGINDSGTIVGYYTDATGALHGFRDSAGTFSPIDYPDAPLTVAYGISNYGNIVGYYASGATTANGFLDSAGTFTSINYSGAQIIYAWGINDSGDIVGYYTDATGANHGFLYSLGTFTPINYPGALLTVTAITGINDSGTIVGGYYDAETNLHGFVATRAATQSTNVTVTANPLWTDTEITVNSGDEVFITASGKWTFARSYSCGPGGDSTWKGSFKDQFFSGANKAELIAFVGPDPTQGHLGDASFFPQSAGYFAIGEGATFLAPTSGELWLGINDDAISNAVAYNSGSLNANIEMIPGIITGLLTHQVTLNGVNVTNHLPGYMGCPNETAGPSSGSNCFSIQQNFSVCTDNNCSNNSTYWVQNVLQLWQDKKTSHWQVHHSYEVFLNPYPADQKPLFPASNSPGAPCGIGQSCSSDASLSKFPFDLMLTSTLKEDGIYLGASVGGIGLDLFVVSNEDLSPNPELSSSSFIYGANSEGAPSLSQNPDQEPQLMFLGFITEIINGVQHSPVAKFNSGTSGTVLSQWGTPGASGVQIASTSKCSMTSETSTGLLWNVNESGDSATLSFSSKKNLQSEGLLFVPSNQENSSSFSTCGPFQ